MPIFSLIPKSKKGPGVILTSTLNVRHNLPANSLVDIAVNNTAKEWEGAKGLTISVAIQRSIDGGRSWQYFVGYTAVGGPLAKDEDGRTQLPAVRDLQIPPDTTHLRGAITLNREFITGINLTTK